MNPFLLIGSISLGLGAAGLVMLGFRLGGGRAPRWLPPATAGAVMIGFHVWMEYAWFDRMRLQLSEGVTIVRTVPASAWWQPWSLVRPPVVRFTAIVDATVEPVGEDLARIELWLVDRFNGSARIAQLYDCGEPRRADLRKGGSLPSEDPPLEAEWRRVSPDDPTRRAASRLAGRPVEGVTRPVDGGPAGPSTG